MGLITVRVKYQIAKLSPRPSLRLRWLYFQLSLPPTHQPSSAPTCLLKNFLTVKMETEFWWFWAPNRKLFSNFSNHFYVGNVGKISQSHCALYECIDWELSTWKLRWQFMSNFRRLNIKLKQPGQKGNTLGFTNFFSHYRYQKIKDDGHEENDYVSILTLFLSYRNLVSSSN